MNRGVVKAKRLPRTGLNHRGANGSGVESGVIPGNDPSGLNAASVASDGPMAIANAIEDRRVRAPLVRRGLQVRVR